MRRNRLLVRVPAALKARRGPAAILAIATVLLAPLPVAAAPARIEPGPRSGTPPAVLLPPPPGTTTLVSPRRGGGFANGGSSEPSISENGRWVAFTSVATNLVAAGAATPPSPAVFIRDRTTGTTILVPPPSGVTGGGSAGEPSISADGNVVAFSYQAPVGAVLLVSGRAIYAWDRRTGRTDLVSRTTKGQAAGNSSAPSVSSNGRYVAYTSQSPSISLLDTGTNPDVFRYDRSTQRTVLVSAGPGGRSAGGSSISPSISADGNLVAFVSDAGDAIVAEDTGAGDQVYVRDIRGRVTERISGPPGGGPADGAAEGPSISANGRYVAFESAASNLVAGDDGRFTDVFRRDRRTGTTELVSVTPAGTPGGDVSGQAAISADGQMVAFASAAPDLVGGATALDAIHLAALATQRSEVYERDLVTRETVLVSVTPAGVPGGGRSLIPVVGGSGRYVAFASTSATLVAGDKLAFADVFLRDFPPRPVLNPPVLDLGEQAVDAPGLAAAAVLTNTGLAPVQVSAASIAGANRHSFSVVADACDGRTLRRGQACTVSVEFSPPRPGTQTATLQVPDSAAGSPRTARLRGVGSPRAAGRIELNPPVGPPGIVTIATGSGFPPGAVIGLRWSIGITPRLGPIVADAGGRFRVQVLVLHGDQTGRRMLIAEPAAGTAFTPVSVPMLVTPASVAPPGFLLRRFIDLPLFMLFRG